MIDWDKLQSIPSSENYHINKYHIPANNIPLTDSTVKDLNELFEELFYDHYRVGGFTPSGALKKDSRIKGKCFWITASSQQVQFIIRKPYKGELYDFNLILGQRDTTDKEYVSGGHSWNVFTKVLKKFHIYDKFMSQAIPVNEGKFEKQNIDTPLIKILDAEILKTYTNTYHIDLNSSFMAGIANKWYWMKPAIEHMYEKRKQYPIYKHVLTHIYGFMQSKYLKGYLHKPGYGEYAFAHMSREAVRWNNEYILSLISKLRFLGYKVLATNTDGIWYQDINNIGPYHDRNEGPQLGQWKTNVSEATIRFKSRGAYEYMVGEDYFPVVRGTTLLDRIIPREQWKWGDIFQEDAVPIMYVLKGGIKEPYRIEVQYENF